MAPAIRDIAWLAGLLEGEACFGSYNGCLSIQLQMIDEDIVLRVAPACHPERPVFAKKMCRSCYNADYHQRRREG
jgi:hypothetical protein